MSTQTPPADDQNKNDQTGKPGTGNPNEGGQAPQPESIDYKQKFSDSTREVQRLLDQDKKKEAEIERLKAENSSLKGAATRQSGAGGSPNQLQPSPAGTNDIDEIKKLIAPIIDRDRFNTEYAVFSKMPHYEMLKGKKKEFKEFCYLAENLNVPTEILAARFCSMKAKETSTNKPTEEEEEPIGLLPGNGGQSTPPSNNGFTDEELASLRKNDPRRYNRLAKQGKLINRNK